MPFLHFHMKECVAVRTVLSFFNVPSTLSLNLKSFIIIMQGECEGGGGRGEKNYISKENAQDEHISKDIFQHYVPLLRSLQICQQKSRYGSINNPWHCVFPN